MRGRDDGGRCVRAPILVIAAALALAGAARAQQWVVEDVGQGPVPLAPGAHDAHELSGLVWAGGERFYAVSDKRGGLFRLRIAVTPGDGAIAAAAVEGVQRLPESHDLEGIVMGAGGDRVFVVDEVGPALREHRLADGAVLRRAAVPAPFTALRHNLGFEALARDPAGALWVANEDALAVDGATSNRSDGSWVRLQRFDADLQPAGQWAYHLDPVDGALLVPSRGTGLSELVALPDGRLLALERSLSASDLRLRLYELDLAGATDVATRPSLPAADVRPVQKHLRWERRAPDLNVEGAALGPPLADGSRSLLLISDDGHRLRQALYALRVRPLAPPADGPPPAGD